MSDQSFEASRPNRQAREEAAMPYSPGHHEPSRIDGVKETHEARLMALDGVEGVGLGQDPVGNDAIVVYVRDQKSALQIPKEIDGSPVVVKVTGLITTLPK